jgi:hypothetical protein
MRLPSPGSLLETLLTGFSCIAIGAFGARALGFANTVGLLGIALVLHLLARVLGDKAPLIIFSCAFGIFLAVRMGWATSSLLPSG